MNPEIFTSVPQNNPNPQDSSVVTQQSTSVSKPHKWRRRLVWALNIVPPLLFILLIAWLSYEQAHGVSGTEFIAIIFAPIFGLFFLVTFVIDTTILIRFLRRSRNVPSTTKSKKYLAWAGLAFILLILSGFAYSLIQGVRDSKHQSQQAAAEEEKTFKSNYQRAVDTGNGFSILLPTYLPSGYTYAYGQISYGLTPKDTGLDVRYQNTSKNDQSYDFNIDIFKVPSTFKPPTNCGYPFAPPRQDDPDSLALFPCEIIATGINSSPIYYSDAEGNLGYDAPTDVYYTTFSDTYVTLSTNKGYGSISKDESVKVINSLKKTSIEEIINQNKKAGKY